MSMVSVRLLRVRLPVPNSPLPRGSGSSSWSRSCRPYPYPGPPMSDSASSVVGDPESTIILPSVPYTCTRVRVVSAAAWAHDVRSGIVVSGGGSATISLALAVR